MDVPDAEIVSDLVSRVGFKVDLTALGTGMDKAKAKVKSLENTAKDSAVKVRRSFQDMATAANLVKAAVAGAAVVAAKQAWDMSVQLATFAQSASDVHDYFNTSFGSMAETARDWAESLADSYEIYEEDVEQYMANLNQAFLTSGNTMRASYDMAKDFTQLSYDLTRYYSDLSLEEIQSALTDLAGGEASGALKKLKISMSELDIKNKAIAEGIAEQGKELTAAQKQAVAYKIIMEQLGDAQGMYGESAGNLGNAMTSLDASVKELKESIGTVLTPVVWAFSKVVKTVVDRITGWIDDMTRKVDNFVNAIKGGVNGVANLLGFDDVFESMDTATTSTGALDAALSTLQTQAEETYKSVNKLAGFDRMYVLDTTPTEETSADTGMMDAFASADWKAAMEDWTQMFNTAPDQAVDALDAIWDNLKQGTFDSVDTLKAQYGALFDWILDEDLEGTNLSVEERQRIYDQMYIDMYGQYARYKQREKEINEEYDSLIAKARLDGDEELATSLEAKRQEILNTLSEDTQTTLTTMAGDTLVKVGVIDQETADNMKKAFDKRGKIISSTYTGLLKDINTLIDTSNSKLIAIMAEYEEFKKGLSELESQKQEPEKKGFWASAWDGLVNFGSDVVDQLKDIGRSGVGLPRFADGGVFEPNSPQAVIVGDNTREREVIAPETMIENAVTRALNRQGSSFGNTPLTIPITLTLDGRVLASVMYKYNQQEATRRGV